MRVEIDIFSGRPNPAWELTEAERTELERRMASLRPSPRLPIDFPLGYRGFLVHDPGRTEGLPGQIRVWRGTVTFTEAGLDIVYDDVNGIEEWLMLEAGKHGYGELLRECSG